jgi:hypothetical protein
MGCFGGHYFEFFSSKHSNLRVEKSSKIQAEKDLILAGKRWSWNTVSIERKYYNHDSIN